MNHLQLQESPRPRPREQEQDFKVIVTVPPFRNENTSLLQAAGIGKEEQEQADKVDAFLFYSDDEVRMRRLRLSGGIVGADQRSTFTPAQVRTRKTRISFELHPSVFMEELLLSDESFSDNEEETAKAMIEDRFLYSISKLYANIRAPRAA